MHKLQTHIRVRSVNTPACFGGSVLLLLFIHQI